MTRRVHQAASRKARSGNIVPFGSNNVLISTMLRLLLRTSRTAGLMRLTFAVILACVGATAFLVFGVGIAPLVLCVIIALSLFATNRRALLPREMWEDPSVVGVNRLDPHSRLGMYTSFEQAAARGCSSPRIACLSGTWKFRLVCGVDKAPAGFENPDFVDDYWDDIKVPGHWQLQDAGSGDPPIYTNTTYPFPNRPPYAPRDNPTGLYRRSFSIPAEWWTQRGCAAEMQGSASAGEAAHPFPGQRHASTGLKGRVILVFNGVDSAFHLWLNGFPVGFAKGSRLPCEFDVTDALLAGKREQCLCLRVVRWSDGSYLEDQDHWWLSGVYRDVEMVLTPAPVRISDYVVRPFLQEDESGRYTKGSMEVEVLVESDPSLARSPSSPVASDGWIRRRRSKLTGKVGDNHRRGNQTFSLDRVEAGSMRDGASGLDDAEVACTLIDAFTGERYSLTFDRVLPDWQMGSLPGESRQDLGGGGYARRSGPSRRDSTRYPDSMSSAMPARATERSVRLFRLNLPGETRAWSAEEPRLYTLVIGLTGEDGASLQFESAKVGFRSVRVASGQVLVNGRAVMMAGVNRHEHDPDTGKTVSEESMRNDIIMMKRFNFNAVRNCHYPNHWRWYELCDELGLYVCDEANIESHGQIPLCRLSVDPAWRLAYLDRVWRMLATNKNHACIILWSLGNESGDGDNLTACRELVKDVEPSRPVMYEGGGKLAEGCGCTELTDVVCPMYSSVERTEQVGTDGPGGIGETRPCVLCEYSHAMGNSNGNLHKYWELFRKHRRLQGGFIWDWADQGLTKYDAASGRRYWADGGGFGSRHSEGYEYFCVNGVTFPDRAPHPALWEAKFLAQPMGVEPVCDHPGSGPALPDSLATLSISNRYDFLSLDHLSAAWFLKSESAVAEGEFSVVGIAPGESREVVIDLAAGKKRLRARNADQIVEDGGGDNLFLHVEARLRSDTPWAPAGHLVAWGCFPVSGSERGRSNAHGRAGALAEGEPRGAGAERPGEGGVAQTMSPSLIIYDDEGDVSISSREGSPMGQLREHLLLKSPAPVPSSSLIVIKGLLGPAGADNTAGAKRHRPAREWTLAVSRVDGSIQRFVAGGTNLIEPGAGPSLCLWRAATDNDRAGWPTLGNFVIHHGYIALLAKFLPLSYHSHLARWKANGVCATEPPVLYTKGVRVEKASTQECIIKTSASCVSRRGRCRRRLFDVSTDIRVSPGGKVEITTSVRPVGRAFAKCVSLARVGLQLKVPRGFGRVQWFGRGPFECYQDRKHGAKTDLFDDTVDAQHVPYMNPSENGGKADVHWMALRRGQHGPGVAFRAGPGEMFEAASCNLYSAAELQEAKRTIDLPERSSDEHPVYVHLDHRSMGVGGDNSWYPDVVHEEYTLPADRAYKFSVRLEVLASADGAPI